MLSYSGMLLSRGLTFHQSLTHQMRNVAIATLAHQHWSDCRSGPSVRRSTGSGPRDVS